MVNVTIYGIHGSYGLWVILARKSRSLESPSLVLAQILVYAALNKGGPAETAQVHAEESGAQLVKTPED